MTRALLLALMVGLSACATSPAPYGPAQRAGGPGFSDIRIENNRYRVTYRGAANEAMAADYALRHAADLTLAQGDDWFVVDNRSSEREAANRGPRVGVGVGTGSIGRHTSVGIGTSVGFNLGAGGASTVYLEIRTGRGPRPDDANAYDARQVQASMRTRG